MSAPLSTTGASSESHTWQELEDVFAALGQLARSTVAPQEFYRSVLDQSVRALSATGGAVWLRAAGGSLQPIVQTGWPSAELARDENARRAHERLLIESAATGRVVTIGPHSVQSTTDASNTTGRVLLIGPVNVADSGAAKSLVATKAIIELLMRPDASPATHRGCEQFLTAVCELAVDYHAFGELRRLRETDAGRNQLLQFGRNAHRQLRLLETAFAIANEGRGVVGCDRLSVLTARGRRCRLLAASGVSRIERRSGAARRLEQVATLVCRTDEAAFYADGNSDALPPVAEALEEHADEMHAREIAAIPLRRLDVPGTGDERSDQSAHRRSQRPEFVLIAEQFDARGLDRDRLVEVGDVCASALYNAAEYERIPAGWLLRPLGVAKEQLTAHFSRTLLGLMAVAAAVAALVFVQADFKIEAPGTLEPKLRRDVFAPRSGLVDEVLVAHGADVKPGQPLVRLRDPSLELELKRVDGELETVQRQLDAVRATRTSREVRDADPTESYRLSAEERELQQRQTNLRQELELLTHDREELVVTSPIAGRVLTWDVGHRLIARPVERGEVLVSVADLSADWQLELDVPDDRIGYVMAAQHELTAELPVRFRLSSDDQGQHQGHIAEICQTADVDAANGTAPTPTVLVKVALDKLELSDIARDELRPGVSARAQIECGRKPLGYVWLHDIWDTAIEWLRY